jgi:hypothetical protein
MMFQNSKRRLGRGIDLTLREAQKEKATVVVGGEVSRFDDDLEFRCEDCYSVIYLRPHWTKTAIRTAKKICVQCAVIEIGLKDQKGEKVNAIVSKETIDELREDLLDGDK